MIATLVVQPPRLHDGGDLVVYQNGEVKFRHDFGKSVGTAAYHPYYAVHYADAEHALEEVKKGYRLALVYSICLPPTMRHLEISRDQSLIESLANAISKMEGDDDSFALLLAHQYTENMVSKEKELIFFIVQLRHYVSSYEGYDTSERQDDENGISWYTVAGDVLGTVCDVGERINFLNPGQETLEDLWCVFGEITQEGGYTGNEGSTCIATYTRCAIVAWQKVKHRGKAMKWMPGVTAAAALLSCEEVDGTTVRRLLESVMEKKYYSLVCEVLAKAGDSEVVVLYFKKYCPCYEDTPCDEIEKLGTPLTRLIRAFYWSEIGGAVLASLAFGMAIYVLNGLNGGAAQEALIKLAVEKADAMDESALLAEDKSLFDTVTKKLANADTSLVGPSIQYFSHYLSEGEKEKRAVLAPIVRKHGKWLEDKIKALDKKFTWEMPGAHLLKPGKARTTETAEIVKIQTFLRSGEISMTTKGVKSFKNLQDAHNSAAKYMRDGQNDCSFDMEATKADEEGAEGANVKEAGGGKDKGMKNEEESDEKSDEEAVDDAVIVTITKTRDWFMKQQKELVQYQTELRIIKEKFGDAFEAKTGDKKRARLKK